MVRVFSSSDTEFLEIEDMKREKEGKTERHLAVEGTQCYTIQVINSTYLFNFPPFLVTKLTLHIILLSY